MKGSQFKNLEIGDRFTLRHRGDQVMMKIPPVEIGGAPYNAVNDSNGILAYIQAAGQVFRFTGAMRVVSSSLKEVQHIPLISVKPGASKKQQRLARLDPQGSGQAAPSEPEESAQD